MNVLEEVNRAQRIPYLIVQNPGSFKVIRTTPANKDLLLWRKEIAKKIVYCLTVNAIYLH